MKTTRGIVIREVDRPWEGWLDPIINAKSPIFWKLLVTGECTPSEGLTMGIAEIPPGAALLLHHHKPEEVYYVLAGEGTVEIESRAAHIGPGSALFIPRNAKHRTINTGAAPLRFLFVFPRDTFQEVEYYYDE